MEDFGSILSKVTDFLKSEAKTETIVGQQFKLGEFTCVPVMSIGMGFGGGEGKGSVKNVNQGEGIGSGTGVGLGMGAVGFLVTKGGEIQFISTKSSKGLSAAFEKLPDLFEKYMATAKPSEHLHEVV